MFRYGPHYYAHYTRMCHRTYPIRDAPLSRSAVCSFVLLQKSRRNHCSYVFLSFHLILLNSLCHQLFIFFVTPEEIAGKGGPWTYFGARHSLQFLSPPLKIFIVLGYGNTRDSAQPQNVISDDWEAWERISQKLIFWRYGLEGRGGSWGIFELLWFWRGICGIIRQLSRRVRFRFVLYIFFSDGLYPYVFRSVLLFFFLE